MTTRIYVVPFQCNFFPIYAESPIIKEGHKPVDYIELCEIYEIGQEIQRIFLLMQAKYVMCIIWRMVRYQSIRTLHPKQPVLLKTFLQ